MKSQIEALADKYYNMITHDHHKDRDCHFHIEKIFSYGEDTGWHIYHLGYLNEIREGPFSTYQEAEDCLAFLLEDIIETELNNDNS